MKKLLLLVLVLTLVLNGCANSSDAVASEKPHIKFWYYEFEEPDQVQQQVLSELRKYATKNRVDVEYVKYDYTKMSEADYLKKLSIALSTGECDIAYTNARALKTYEKSLVSLEGTDAYDRLMPTLKLGNFLLLEYYQPTYGVNKNVLDEYGIEYSDCIDIHEYFAIKQAYRDAGGKLLLDGTELEELIDEVLIPRNYQENLSGLDYKELYEDYEKILSIAQSATYDYSDLEVYGYYNSWTRYKNEKSFAYTINSGFNTNRLNSKRVSYLNVNYFLPFTDMRFNFAAKANWRKPAVGVSIFSKEKELSLKFISQLLEQPYQKFQHSRGMSSLTGYEDIAPYRYNDLLKNYVIEKTAYEAAEAGDERFNLAGVNLGDLKIRDIMLLHVLESIKKQKKIPYDEFQWEVSAQVMEYMVMMGER